MNSVLVLILLLITSCQEVVKKSENPPKNPIEENVKLLKKTNVENTKLLFKHSDQKVQYFQNIEIRAALIDFDTELLSFCMDNEKVPSKEFILKAGFSNYDSSVTDIKGVHDIEFTDIKITSYNFIYNPEDFECQGVINIEIPKLSWSGTVTIPQRINEFDFYDKGRRKLIKH